MPDPEVVKELYRNRRLLTLVISFLVLVACLYGLFVLDPRWRGSGEPDGALRVLPLMVAVPSYFALEIIGQAAGEALGETGRGWGRAVAVAALVVFYIIWFARVF